MGFKVRLHFPFLIQEKIALQFHHAVLGQKINGQWQVISTVSTDEEGLIFCLHLKAESEINIARPISHQERERERERKKRQSSVRSLQPKHHGEDKRL